jgi:hypothetical protein
MKNPGTPKTTILITALLMMLRMTISAQSHYSSEESGQGYWQLHTDFSSKSTIVQFFDADHQPIYQETMPSKYIKLTKKNIRRFDHLLSQLMNKNLLTSMVRSYDLIADNRPDFRDISRPVTNAASLSESSKTFTSNIYVLNKGKMKIMLKNPTREFFTVTIRDSELRTIYYEPIAYTSYGRWFDVSNLQEGAYTVQINSKIKRLSYKLTVDGYSNSYQLEAIK